MKKYWILIVIALILIVGFVPFIKTGQTICPSAPPCYEAATISIVDWIRYKDNLKSNNKYGSVNKILSEFADLASWEISENSTEWRVISFDTNHLAKYPKGNITTMIKTFNGPDGLSGPKGLDKARIEEDQLIEDRKSVV